MSFKPIRCTTMTVTSHFSRAYQQASHGGTWCLCECRLVVLFSSSLSLLTFVTLFTSQSGDERIAIERRAREVAEERLRRVMQEAEAR